MLLTLSLSNAGAQNLVHNPSFELASACPSDTGQISFASEWFAAGGGADYYDSCCNDCLVDVPLNHKGYQLAYSGGHAYAGIYLYREYFPNYRSYIQGTVDALTPGHWYKVKIHVSSSSQMQYECGCPGIFFYINQTIPTTMQVLPFNPQIDNNFQIGNDTVTWIVPNNIFYADSAYTKILIGNFNDDAHSAIDHNAFQYPLTPEAHAAYTYIDEVSVVDITAAYLAGLETEQQTITAYPNPFTKQTTLSFDNPQQQPHTLTVYNMQGMLVRRVENIVGNEVTLQRDDLPAGYYFYRLSNNEGISASGKLLIQ